MHTHTSKGAFYLGGSAKEEIPIEEEGENEQDVLKQLGQLPLHFCNGKATRQYCSGGGQVGSWQGGVDCEGMKEGFGKGEVQKRMGGRSLGRMRG